MCNLSGVVLASSILACASIYALGGVNGGESETVMNALPRQSWWIPVSQFIISSFGNYAEDTFEDVIGYGENDNVKNIFLLNFVAAISVSIPATIFENHNALMLLATSNLWALLWSSPCQVHWRTIGWMMVGQFLSNQLWCGVGLSCCWWFDQRRGGAVKLLGLLTNAPRCAAKT